MKFTNVKQLIIKFMGGGLINFPTRFLRWVKINGDTEDDGSGGDDGGNSEFNNKEFGDSVIRTYFDKNNISYDNVDYWPDLYVNIADKILNSYEDFALSGLSNIKYLYKNAPYNLQDSDFDENNGYQGTVGENDKIYIGQDRNPIIAEVYNTIEVYKAQINGETYYILYTSTDK